MSINSVSQAMSASSWGVSAIRLPEDIIQKLIELGYNPNEVTTLAQAKDLIQKSENQAQNNSNSNSKQNKSDDNKDNPALYLRAKNLAQKMGLNVGSNLTLDDILSKISDESDKIMKKAVDCNDRLLFEKAKMFKSELQSLQEDVNGGGISNGIVYSYMDMIAKQNKLALGL